MKLDFIPLDRLSVSTANMRFGKKAPDISDILPTVRRRGILQPVIVRRNGQPDHYEIVAGSRRFHAALAVAAERAAAGEPPEAQALMPCAILDNDDDAGAVEASLIENVARLDADEVTQWETFTRLVREGRTLDDIATTFGLPELAVRRVLALGNLLPRIRLMYAREEIDRTTVRHLTLASKSQQKAWLALADSPDAYCPTGHQLKAWLFGGQSIAASHALFDVETSGLAIVADLFGEEAYFADAEAFWTHQNEAVEAKRAAFVEEGWADAIVIPPSDHFATWDYDKAGKRKGGKVYLDVRATGEIVIHEGYISRREAARLARGETGASDAKPARPELTSAMQTYVDLHRHAAVRAELTGHPGVALRLMVAHAIAGSPLWRLSAEPQATRNDAIRESVETCPGEAKFDERRRAVLGVLGMDPERSTVTRSNGDDFALAALFARLLDLPDAAVLDVIAIVMGETLASGSVAVAAVGMHIGVAMSGCWQADDAFFALIRDRELLTAMVAEVAGEGVAAANAKEKSSTMKAIVRDALDGSNGREKCEGWVPRWMRFPPSAYTQRGGVGTVVAHARAEAACLDEQAGDEPDPGAPGAMAMEDDLAEADDSGSPDTRDSSEQSGASEPLEATGLPQPPVEDARDAEPLAA